MIFLYFVITNLYFTPNLATRNVAVVTGGNRGLGFATVKALCERFSGDVYLTARNLSRGLSATEALNKLGFKPKFHLLDIANITSIQTFKNHLLQEYGGLDVLINNAAIAYKIRCNVSFDVQTNETFRINYFGLKNVCKMLYPILRPHARIVHVTSSMGHLTRIPRESWREKFFSENLTELELDKLVNTFIEAVHDYRHVLDGWPNNAYGISKVAITALARIHQREFSKKQNPPDVIVNAVFPGDMATEMSSNRGFKTPEFGAEGLLRAVFIPHNAEKPKGAYLWHDGKEVDWKEGPVPFP